MVSVLTLKLPGVFWAVGVAVTKSLGLLFGDPERRTPLLRTLNALAKPFWMVIMPAFPTPKVPIESLVPAPLTLMLLHSPKGPPVAFLTTNPFRTRPTTCCGLLIGMEGLEPLTETVSVIWLGLAVVPTALNWLALARMLVMRKVRVPPEVPGASIGIPAKVIELGWFAFQVP